MSKKNTSMLNSSLPNGYPLGASNWFVGMEKKSSLSSVMLSQTNDTLQINDMFRAFHTGHDSADTSTPLHEKPHELSSFASSLPSFLHKKLNLKSTVEWTDAIQDQVVAEEPLDQDIVARAIGDILPNEDDFLSGLSTGFLTNVIEENEDVDLFSSGGGLEMDSEPQEGLSTYRNSSKGLDGLSGANFHGPVLNGSGSVIGEHPYGEHPSRTLFVRNINSNAEDSELRSLFEQYGDIRTLYTACKHRGFVMISYYDIRAARSAMRALQNKPLRRRKLDIHFSIPKDNPSDKDINQGTLVVFNLDASVSNDDLRQIFGQYGEVKEIRETPHKRHHKFIEFYDVRAADAALRALNRSDIAGKRIKLEPSRPGGARRSLMQQISQDTEQDDVRLYWQQSSPPVANSPPGPFSLWGYVGSPSDSGFHRSLHSNGNSVPSTSKNLPNLPIPRVGTIGSHLGRSNQIDAGLSSLQSGLGVKVLPHHAQSLPEYRNSVMPFLNSSIPATLRDSSKGSDIESPQFLKASSEASLFEHAPGGSEMSSNHGLNSVSLGNGSLSALNAVSSGAGTLSGLNAVSIGNASLSGPQFLWGNSSHFQQNNSSMDWSISSPMGPNVSVIDHMQSPTYGPATNHLHYINGGLHSQGHHVGSAPADPSYLDRLAYGCGSPDVPFFSPIANPSKIPGAAGNKVLGHGVTHSTVGANGFIETGISPNLGVISPHYKSPMFHPRGILLSGYFDMVGVDRGHIRRIENNASQSDNKKQYQLDIDRISRGEDKRTTLMIKNIPNKYTSKMLLAAIDENHKGMYDFLYLPIDFKNKCNVGYAFINMTSPEYIIPLYQSFNGKKWEKFNSEKVVSLAYARIQGKAALVAHFQNSSLMNEDKRCRPILLNSDGFENNEQEPTYLEIGTRPLIVSDAVGTVASKVDASNSSLSAAMNSNFPEKK